MAESEEGAGKQRSECVQHRNFSEGADSVGGHRMLDAQRAMPIQWTVTNFGRVSVEEGCRKAKLGVYKGLAVTRPKYLHELARGENHE